jgi:hypothetical protein
MVLFFLWNRLVIKINESKNRPFFDNIVAGLLFQVRFYVLTQANCPCTHAAWRTKFIYAVPECFHLFSQPDHSGTGLVDGGVGFFHAGFRVAQLRCPCVAG